MDAASIEKLTKENLATIVRGQTAVLKEYYEPTGEKEGKSINEEQFDSLINALVADNRKTQPTSKVKLT